jgi:hypothetical protein
MSTEGAAHGAGCLWCRTVGARLHVVVGLTVGGPVDHGLTAVAISFRPFGPGARVRRVGGEVWDEGGGKNQSEMRSRLTRFVRPTPYHQSRDWPVFLRVSAGDCGEGFADAGRNR